MPRIPYLPRDLEQPAELVAAIRARRGGELLNLDRMLLHSPPFAAGWNGFLAAVRSGLVLDASLRESGPAADGTRSMRCAIRCVRCATARSSTPPRGRRCS